MLRGLLAIRRQARSGSASAQRVRPEPGDDRVDLIGRGQLAHGCAAQVRDMGRRGQSQPDRTHRRRRRGVRLARAERGHIEGADETEMHVQVGRALELDEQVLSPRRRLVQLATGEVCRSLGEASLRARRRGQSASERTVE